jgi:metal-dependent amidase/aminoacylase/carboxypeptidase family protein
VLHRVYADMVDNPVLAGLYAANAAALGRPVTDPRKVEPRVVGSTDMGNISYLVPSIHPMIQVSPPNVAIHSADFVRYAGGEEGDKAVIDGAKMLACTVADLWCRPEKLDEVRAAFEGADRVS